MQDDFHVFPVRVVTKCVVSCLQSTSKRGNKQALEIYLVYVNTSVLALLDSLFCKPRVNEFIIAVHLKPTLQRKSLGAFLDLFKYLIGSLVSFGVSVPDQQNGALAHTLLN